MKILTYNINGIRAFFKNGKWDELKNEHPADVYCLQETKADTTTVEKLVPEDYVVYSVHNTWKKGYAGVATLIKKELNDKVISVKTPDILPGYGYCLGRVVEIEFENFVLINVYVLNSGGKEKERQMFDKAFKEYCKLITKDVIIVGDLNVCATAFDYWGNYDKAVNSAPGLMQFEIDGVGMLINENHMDDIYRRDNPEGRDYSWYSQRNKKSIIEGKGWRLDYVLATRNIADNIKDLKIHSAYQGADHSPISFDVCVG